MQHIVIDTSCMIDLGKAALLDAALTLPYSFVIPDILFENEWLYPSNKNFLCSSKLDVRELPGPDVERAATYFNRHRALKINDCFLLAMAESLKGSILLTGDRALRTIAASNGIEVHGILWVIDALQSQEIVPLRELYDALQLFHDDPRVFLPTHEILQRIKRIEELLEPSI